MLVGQTVNDCNCILETKYAGAEGPQLRWETEDERRREEDRLLDWVAHLAFVLKRSHSTIKNKIGHIGEVHVEAGELNPLDSFPRVRKAHQMLNRLQAPREYIWCLGQTRFARKSRFHRSHQI